MQISIGLLLLPVFLAAWFLVVTSNILYTVFHSLLTLPRAKWTDIQSHTQILVEAKERAEYEATKKREDQEAAKEDTQKDADRATIQEDKANRKKQLRRKPSGDGFQKKLRQIRDEEEEQLKDKVTLLIPKQLYESNNKGVISRRKKTVRTSNPSEEKDAELLRGSHEGDHASAGPITPPQAQASIISKIISVFRHQSDTAVASKEEV